MNFQHYNLGHVNRGSVVEVTLQGSAANVRLMDNSNFNSFRAGRQHRFHGGLATKSPVRLQVASSGMWHVTVDMQGLRGTVRSSIRVIPSEALRPLPTINEAPLSSIPSLVRNIEDTEPYVDTEECRSYDVFISHASEDKPLELERIVDGHPAVYESAAVAVQPEGEGAERLVVFVVQEGGDGPASFRADARAGSSPISQADTSPAVPTDSHAGLDHDLDPNALKSELQDMVSSGLNPLFKIYRVIVVDELPHTASGKLVRRILRDRMKSGD